ncbi:hypothetical protein LCGC14_0932530 [marine sediment metagenome]|uniref:SAP domain-containing protein n=1 Tax=marine sediment metagenome TaxID=412755 RepID=A0A0F9RU10_9ZZZZ
MQRTTITITNRNRAAVRSLGRRFRPGIPRTLDLLDRQIRIVRGNPWLWIEGEDWGGEPVDLGNFHENELRELAHGLSLDKTGSKHELIDRIERARDEIEYDLDGEVDEEESPEEDESTEDAYPEGDEDSDEEIADPGEETDEEASWEGYSVSELKDELRDRDLPVSGTRLELIDRLEAFEEEEDE